MSYISTHCHSEFSNFKYLDSTNKLEVLIEKAHLLNLKGIAITDHESVAGHVRAIKTAKKIMKEDPNFKVILGDEIYLVDSLEEVRDNYQSGITKFPHFILLSKDEIGGEQIRRISSQAWMNSYYTGKIERTPIEKRQLKEIIGEDKGHIIASTGCIGGELAQHILSHSVRECEDFLCWCLDVFGEDNFYLEMQPNDCEEQVKVNQTIIKISEQTNIPFIISTDVHYYTKNDAKIHEAYLNSREDESREIGDFYKSCYLMTREEIHKWMDKQIGADNVDKGLNNTLVIGDNCKFYDLEHDTIVPDAVVPDFELRHIFKAYYETHEYIYKYSISDNIYDRYLLKLIEDGFENKLGWEIDNLSEVIDRIEVELKEMWLVTEKLGTSISSYYITTLDLVNTMWEEGDSLVGIARGSVTGMLTMYLIGITQMNPMKYGLPHWRHISHSKIELSDVDLDSSANRRTKIFEAIRNKRGFNKALNCSTFKTEGSKSALLSAARGLGINNDIAQYLASLIPVTRGFTWSIEDCLYGNEEEGRKPVTEFINEISQYDRLLETTLALQGLICGRSIHASAVYLFNDDFNKHNALMKAPNGVYITQFNMKDSDYASGLKEDLLTIKALDKIRLCMDLLVDAGYMEDKGSLRATYDAYLHPDVLDYDTPEMWDAVCNGEITDLFQFDSSIGVQAIKKIKPRSFTELAVASTMMRLMVSEEGAEQPIDTYVRYKNNIDEWYKDMRDNYQLTDNEISIVEKYLLQYQGIGGNQEDVMEISMDPSITNFSIKDSNRLRKSISKKSLELQHQMKKEFFEAGNNLGTSENLLNYVWNEVIGKQLGYSFSRNHVFPYAGIAMQMMNLYFHYPHVFYNCAVLSINAGADEDVEDNKSTQYGRVSIAVNNMLLSGIDISMPLINECKFGFIPDEKNNRIIYALKAMNGIGDEVAATIIKNQPYSSMDDFYKRMIETKLVTNSQMIMLIKGGCFTELHSKNRIETMRDYLTKYIFKPVSKLTMSQLNSILNMNILPDNYKMQIKYLNFKNYVLDENHFVEYVIDKAKKIPKCGYHDRLFVLDGNSQPFFCENMTEDCVVRLKDEYYVISEKLFCKEIENKVLPLREWFISDEAVSTYNNAIFKQVWDEYAKGSLPSWTMQSLGYYDDEHELAHVDEKLYGVSNFFTLPEEPCPYEYYIRYINNEPKEMPKYNITRIMGTVISSDNTRHTVSLLTCYGIVNVKFDKGTYSAYTKQISITDESTGKKTVVDKNWFARGNKLLVCGFRREEQFVPRKYADTIFKHTVNKIIDIHDDGTLLVQQERTKI